MGQYYKCVNLNKKQILVPWSFDSGAKLMEHSWLQNNFMTTAMSLLVSKWKGDQIVWAGDYMDKGLFIEKLEPKSYQAGDRIYEHTLYSYASEYFEEIKPEVFNTGIFNEQYPYLVNHDLKEYVDLNIVPNNDGWKVHPLSLLTCSSNGRGGGDYNDKNGEKYIGSWAGHRIGVEKLPPLHYQEIAPGFCEF